MTKEQLLQYMGDTYPVSNNSESVDMVVKQMNDVIPKIESGEITTNAEIDSVLA